MDLLWHAAASWKTSKATWDSLSNFPLKWSDRMRWSRSDTDAVRGLICGEDKLVLKAVIQNYCWEVVAEIFQDTWEKQGERQISMADHVWQRKDGCVPMVLTQDTDSSLGSTTKVLMQHRGTQTICTSIPLCNMVIVTICNYYSYVVFLVTYM